MSSEEIMTVKWPKRDLFEEGSDQYSLIHMRDGTLHIYKCSGFDLGHVDFFDICDDNHGISNIVMRILAMSFQFVRFFLEFKELL